MLGVLYVDTDDAVQYPERQNATQEIASGETDVASICGFSDGNWLDIISLAWVTVTVCAKRYVQSTFGTPSTVDREPFPRTTGRVNVENASGKTCAMSVGRTPSCRLPFLLSYLKV